MRKEIKKTKKEKWLEVTPCGIVAGMIPEASTMLFKRKEGEGHFAVWLSELQSRITIDQSLNKEQPFGFVQKIFQQNKIEIKNCFFVKAEQGRDTVVLTFKEKSMKPMQAYADEVLSFCILSKCKFFCTKSFLEQPRRELPKRFRHKVLEKKPVYLN